MRVIRCPNPRDAHISDSYVAIFVEEEVFWFYISMHDPIIMHVFQTNENASNEEFRLIFAKSLALVLMISEISASYQVSHQENIFIVREGIEHVDQESENQ